MTQAPRKPQIVTFPIDGPKKKEETLTEKLLAQYNKQQPQQSFHKEKDDNEIQKLHKVKSDISHRIVCERTALGWTQQDLANKSYINVNTIKEYEGGKAVIEPKVQQTILATLDKERKTRKI
jgi:ribosome-binding protein aMBF1 (putative translation factor)